MQIGTDFIIYDSALNGQMLVDDYESVEEVVKWAGLSSLKIKMSRFAQGADLLGTAIDTDTIQYVVFRNDIDNVVYLVEQVERELDEDGNVTDNIVVSCREASFLSERIVLPVAGQMYDSFTGAAQSAMYHYVTANAGSGAALNRQVDNLTVGVDQALGTSVTVNARYDNLEELLYEIHALSPDIGWRTVLDAGSVKFEAVQGNDLSASVYFSHQFDNLKNSKYLNTVLGKKNYGIVAGQGEGAAREIENVFVGATEPTGLRRREAFIDARDIDSSETGAGALAARGEAKLAAMQPAASFEADLYVYGNYQYGTDWRLGDLVTLKNAQWGVTKAVRIVTVKKVRSAEGIDVTAELDSPWPSLKDRIQQTVSASGGSGTVDYPTGGGGGGGSNASYVTLVGDNASTNITITHGLNTDDIIVALWDTTNGLSATPTYDILDDNRIEVQFASAPTTNQYRLVVLAAIGGDSPVGNPVEHVWHDIPSNLSLTTSAQDAALLDIPNPNSEVFIFAEFIGYIYGTTTTVGEVIITLELSFDGGVTWEPGVSGLAGLNGEINLSTIAVMASSGVPVTPTGNVKVRLQARIYDDDGTGGFTLSSNGKLKVSLFHSGNVVLDSRYQKDDDTGWIQPSLQNGWADYGGTFAPIRYRKKNGVVYLEGFADPSASTAVQVFALPEGFRPTHHIYVPSLSSVSTSSNEQLRIHSTGGVHLANYEAGASWVGFSYSFPVE